MCYIIFSIFRSSFSDILQVAQRSSTSFHTRGLYHDASPSTQILRENSAQDNSDRDNSDVPRCSF